MGPEPSDPPKSLEKPRPSDQITVKTPQKLPNPRPRLKNPRHFPHLPDKYEMLVRFFDALDASLKLLRLRKSVPVFSKIRVMVENLSDRRFSHQHLAQLKFLLPEVIGVRKVLFPDEETRCMMHDLHLTLNRISAANPKKRKRGSKNSYLRELLTSRLSQFHRAHPEGTEIPEEDLPEPFNQKKYDHLLNTITKSTSMTYVKEVSSGAVETLPAQASHFSVSFKKHFSKGRLGNGTGNSPKSASVPSLHSPSVSNSYPDEVQTENPEQALKCINQKLSGDTKIFYPPVAETQVTPLKSDKPPIKPATPALQIPRMRNFTPDRKIVSSACNAGKTPSCARSLVFEGASHISNIELQLDEADCSDNLDMLPENVLASLKEKEEKMAKRKQMVVQLPKLFDRILFLFQGPKYSAIRKDVLIHDLTVRHSDITDESEVEEQFKILQEIIPEWIVPRISPSGNILYSINKALKPDSLRWRLDSAV